MMLSRKTVVAVVAALVVVVAAVVEGRSLGKTTAYNGRDLEDRAVCPYRVKHGTKLNEVSCVQPSRQCVQLELKVQGVRYKAACVAVTQTTAIKAKAVVPV